MVRRNRARRVRGVAAMPVSRNQMTGLRVEEVISFSVQVGASTTVVHSTLTTLPARTNFRPIRWVVEACQAYVPATTSLPGYYCPAAIQVDMLADQASSTTTTLKLLAAGITRVSLTPRPDYPWFDYGDKPNIGLLRINAICIGPPDSSSSKAYIRGVIRGFIECMPERCGTACPSITNDLAINDSSH